MSKFKYSKGEQEIVNVLAYQDKRLNALLNEESEYEQHILSEADECISESEELLKSIGFLEKDINSMKKEVEFSHKVRQSKEKDTIVVQNWETLHNRAKCEVGDQCELESLFSAEELRDNQIYIQQLNAEYNMLHQLDSVDFAICVLAGVIAGAVDILLIGIPHRTKTGLKAKPLSDYIRVRFDKIFPKEKIKQLEKIAEVPYDANKNIHYRGKYSTKIHVEGLSAQYHRLLALGHDPLLGFAVGVFDIITGRMTTIDKSGHLVSQVMEGYIDRKETNIFAAITKQFVHLKSDVNSPMGLPAPMMGVFSLLQFGSIGKENQTIAEIVQGMYYEGYDFIHFCSMSIPVMLVEVIVRLLYCLKRMKEGHGIRESLPFSKNRAKVPKLETMLFISHSLSTAINAGKVCFTKNPLAISFPQWMAFANYSYRQLKWALLNKPKLRERYVMGIVNDELKELFREIDDTFQELLEGNIIIFEGT